MLAAMPVAPLTAILAAPLTATLTAPLTATLACSIDRNAGLLATRRRIFRLPARNVNAP